MTGSNEQIPSLLEIGEDLEAARSVPFRLVAALKNLGKLTPQEALQVMDEMLSVVPDDARERSLQHYHEAANGT